MGKRIVSQRRGSANPRYLSPSHRFKGQVVYRPLNKSDKEAVGTVLDIMHDPGHSAPLALVRFEDKDERMIIAPEGLGVGDKVEYMKGEINNGNVISAKDIPEGVPIHNIESVPGDGGKFARSAGSYGFVVSRSSKKVTIKMPSGKVIEVNPKSRATIGIPGGSGRVEKPWIKAGNALKAHKARGKLYPKVSGSRMNAVDHPYGGSTKPGWVKTTSRHAPPGAKVGSIAAKKTGKRKK